MFKRKAAGPPDGSEQPSQKLKHERHRQAYINSMHNFWQKQLDKIKNTDFKNLKQHDLPLARIKKIMKSDDEVKMISAEAPVLFAKACELFILDLTMRAWSHADSHLRRTLMREDVATAVAESDMFDFLLDVVPRTVPGRSKAAPPASPDASSIAEMVPQGLDEKGDGVVRRPIRDPLSAHAVAPLETIIPVPSARQRVGDNPPGAAAPPSAAAAALRDPIFNAASGGPAMLGGATSASAELSNLKRNLKIQDPTNGAQNLLRQSDDQPPLL